MAQNHTSGGMREAVRRLGELPRDRLQVIETAPLVAGVAALIGGAVKFATAVWALPVPGLRRR